MTTRRIRIGQYTGFGKTIDQGMMIITGQIAIDETIDTMSIDERRIGKRSIERIVKTIMTGNIHPDKIEMIDDLTGVIYIMLKEVPMTREEMKTIDHLIVEFRMTIEDLNHLDNFSTIPEAEMSQNHRVSGNHIMRTENPVG
mgnify:CR=1 FL=1